MWKFNRIARDAGIGFNSNVLWPPLMLLSAIVSATWLAYGMNPNVAAEMGGLAVITLTRRLQVLLILLTLLPCFVLIARVAMARTRAWWLIGLSIVVALLFVRFSPENTKPVRIVDASLLPTLDESPADTNDEFVVGFELAGTAYAFPYKSLYRTPIVQLTDFDRRILLIYSPNANSAVALSVTHEIKADDLEFVGAPGNSTLAYNRKFGEFIVGVTGLTDADKTPVGVHGMLQTERVPRRIWKAWHPQSKVLLSDASDASMPGVPVMPRYPLRLSDHSIPVDQPVTLLHTDPPVALLDVKQIDSVRPVAIDAPSLVLWRDAGRMEAFHSTVGGDALTFIAKKDAKGTWQLMDTKTASVWTRQGVCAQGSLKGKRLEPLRIETDVYWGVCKTWWPNLQVVHVRAEN